MQCVHCPRNWAKPVESMTWFENPGHKCHSAWNATIIYLLWPLSKQPLLKCKSTWQRQTPYFLRWISLYFSYVQEKRGHRGGTSWKEKEKVGIRKKKKGGGETDASLKSLFFCKAHVVCFGVNLTWVWLQTW